MKNYDFIIVQGNYEGKTKYWVYRRGEMKFGITISPNDVCVWKVRMKMPIINETP